MVEAPTNSTFTVRPGKVTTEAVAGCSRLQVPAQIVFYTGRSDGSDHVLYSVTYPDGEISLFDVTIHITQAPKAN